MILIYHFYILILISFFHSNSHSNRFNISGITERIIPQTLLSIKFFNSAKNETDVIEIASWCVWGKLTRVAPTVSSWRATIAHIFGLHSDFRCYS